MAGNLDWFRKALKRELEKNNSGGEHGNIFRTKFGDKIKYEEAIRMAVYASDGFRKADSEIKGNNSQDMLGNNGEKTKGKEAFNLTGNSSDGFGKARKTSEDEGNNGPAEKIGCQSKRSYIEQIVDTLFEGNPFGRKGPSYIEYYSFDIPDYILKRRDLKEALYLKLRKWHPKVTVIVKNKGFVCNPMLLNAFSRYFLKLPTAYTSVISLPDGLVTPEQFTLIYNWILAENRELSRRTLVKLYSGAKQLEVTLLAQSCESYIENEVKFCELEAYKLIVEMNAYEVRDIHPMLLLRITRFFQTLISSTDFLRMKIDLVCLFLQSVHIGVNTEGDVLYAGIMWLTEDWYNRRQYVAQVMGCVEFCTVPPGILQDILSSSIVPVQQMRSDEGFMRKVFGGIMFNEFGNTETGIKPDRNDPLKVLKRRRRIYDPHCALHYKPYGEEPKDITFKDFLALMKCNRAKGVDYWATINMFEDSKLPVPSKM